MNEYKENMFELPIYCINIKNWDSKKNLLKNLIEKSNILIKKGETVQSDYEDNGPFNQEIYKIVKEEIEEFCTLSKLYCQKLDSQMKQFLKKEQFFKTGESVVITIGRPLVARSRTNMLTIEQIP